MIRTDSSLTKCNTLRLLGIKLQSQLTTGLITDIEHFLQPRHSSAQQYYIICNNMQRTYISRTWQPKREFCKLITITIINRLNRAGDRVPACLTPLPILNTIEACPAILLHQTISCTSYTIKPRENLLFTNVLYGIIICNITIVIYLINVDCRKHFVWK